MVTAFCEHVCQTVIGEKQLYGDPPEDLLRGSQGSPAFISSEARRSIQRSLKMQLLSILDDNEKFDSWLGSYLTIPLRYTSFCRIVARIDS